MSTERNFFHQKNAGVNINKSRMKRSPVKLTIPQRKCVRQAIRETCTFRGWIHFADNVRTNHAHIVVSAGAKKPSIHLNAFKANATRRLREEGLFTSDGSPWSDKGSERWLWTERHLDAAIDYVKYSQGDDFFVLD